jgi:methionine aminopeptidase
VIKKCFDGDFAIFVPVGQIDPEKARLLRITQQFLDFNIEAAEVGGRLSDIFNAM